MVRIQVVVENTAGKDLLAEHGLSFLIETPDWKVMLDTGQGRVLEENIRILGLEPSAFDALVLSHGHYDHSGGLEKLVHLGFSGDVWLHPQAKAKRFSQSPNGEPRPIGIPAGSLQALESVPARETRVPTEIMPGLWVTGEVPRRAHWEEPGGPFFLDPEMRQPDPVIDDQALFLQTDDGLVVLTGCAHAGVVNTVRYIASLREEPIYALIGGVHLATASDDRLRQTARFLSNLDVQIIGPAHCTGLAASVVFWQQLPGRCVECRAGSVFEFGYNSAQRRT